jgi:hypothetical protein
MTLLIQNSWLHQDGPRLLFFMTCAIAVFAIARWAGNKSESSYTVPPPADPAPKLSFVPVPDPDGDIHPRMRVGGVEVRAFYFKTFNALTGPADPESFCDELTIEVEFVETGNRSQWGFTVGTPKGFEALLREKSWQFLYSPAVFVVQKYDLAKIREAVVERIEIDSSIKPEDTSSIADRVG